MCECDAWPAPPTCVREAPPAGHPHLPLAGVIHHLITFCISPRTMKACAVARGRSTLAALMLLAAVSMAAVRPARSQLSCVRSFGATCALFQKFPLAEAQTVSAPNEGPVYVGVKSLPSSSLRRCTARVAGSCQDWGSAPAMNGVLAVQPSYTPQAPAIVASTDALVRLLTVVSARRLRHRPLTPQHAPVSTASAAARSGVAVRSGRASARS